MLEIRSATPADAAVLEDIARAAYAPYVPLIGREPPPMLQDFPSDIAAGRVWVVGDPAQGYVVGYRAGDNWHLENVAVDPEAGGRGLGKAQIQHIEALAQSDGVDAVELYTHVKMTRNRAMYQQLGYTVTGQATQNGLSRVFFRKTLSAATP